MALLSIGSMGFDSIQTPYAQKNTLIGGSNTYIGLSAAFFHTPIRLVARIGFDFPETTLNLFREKGIDVSGVSRDRTQKSFHYHARYNQDMGIRESLQTELNCLSDFQPLLPPDYQRGNNLVILGNSHPHIQQSVLEQVQEKPKMVVLDTMDKWIKEEKKALYPLLGSVDLICINDKEARLLTEESSLLKAARKLMRQGITYVLIKKGENGVLLFYKDQFFFAPNLPLEEVVDPTGAGDSFIGGLCGYLAQSRNFSFENIKRGIVIGNALASYCIADFGTQKIQDITLEDLQKRTAILKTMGQFEIQITEE